MRKFFVLCLFVLLGLAANVPALAETKTVPAFCAIGPKKIVTNVVDVTVDVDTSSGDQRYIAKKIAEAIANKASQTLYAMGINSEGYTSCSIADPTLMESNENKPLDYLKTLPDQYVGWGYRLVTVSGFGEAAQPEALASEPAKSSDTRRFWVCSASINSNHHAYAEFYSDLTEQEIKQQWTEFAGPKYATDDLACEQRDEGEFRQTWADNSARIARDHPETVNEVVDWSPKKTAKSPNLRRATVFFRSPHDDGRGYSGVSFDIDYQFLVCMGELHLAYSLDQESVHIGTDRITSPSRKAHYTYKAHFYEVSPPLTHVESVPLKGKVYLDDDEIGSFGDDFAGPALGFGCFSGQTKKIADLKDLGRYLSKQPTKEELAKFFDQLKVTFETNEILTSNAAEEEIRAEIAKRAAHNDEHISTGAGDEVARELEGNEAAEERAARRAQEEAEYQAKEKAYEQGIAEHQAAVEQYEKALADMEAQKAANAAAAKAQQEEFARKQAEYEAEAAKAKQAHDEYEAKYGKPQ